MSLAVGLMIGSGETFRVYDCGHPKTKYRAIDLTGPAPCPTIEGTFKDPEETRIQVLQAGNDLPLEAVRCRIVRTVEVTACGNVWAVGGSSVTYASRTTAFKEPVLIERRDCEDALKGNIFNYRGKSIPVTPGKIGYAVLHTRGRVTADGECETEDFLGTDGIYVKDSVEETRLEYKFEKLSGYRSLREDRIIFPELGLTSTFSDGNIRDSQQGYIGWDASEAQCPELVSSIYTGPANILVPRATKNLKLRKDDPTRKAHGIPGLSGSLIMVRDDEKERYAGFSLKQPTAVCGRRCYETQIRDLKVCVLHPHMEPLTNVTYLPRFDPAGPDRSTQIAYLHLDSKLSVGKQFARFAQQLCETGRDILYNALASISGGDNPHALLQTFGPGHQVIRAGAAGYILQCVPREAILAETKNCTHEIPVHIVRPSADGTGPNQPNRNVTRYADPITRNLQEYGTEYPCSDFLPPRWKIDGEWWCSAPSAHRCDDITQLSPRIATDLYIAPRDYAQFSRGLAGGLYTRAQFQRHREFQLTQTARAPALYQITHNMALGGGHGAHGFHSRLGTPLSPETIAEMTHEMGRQVVPWVSIFGLSGYTLIAYIIAIIVILKIVLGIVFRMYLTYQERGCGCGVLFATWQTLYYLMIHTPEFLADYVERRRRKNDRPAGPKARRPERRPGALGRALGRALSRGQPSGQDRHIELQQDPEEPPLRRGQTEEQRQQRLLSGHNYLLGFSDPPPPIDPYLPNNTKPDDQTIPMEANQSCGEEGTSRPLYQYNDPNRGREPPS